MNGLRALGIALGTAGLLSLGAGCAKQAEGARCDLASSGDTDCEVGLSCVAQKNLQDNEVDRCCPSEQDSTHVRCDRATTGQFDGDNGDGGTSGDDGAGGDAGSAGEAGSGGEGAAAGTGGTGGSDE